MENKDEPKSEPVTEVKPEEQKPEELKIEVKHCFKCNQVKRLDEFFSQKNKKRLPYNSQCKVCVTAKNEKYRIRRQEVRKLGKRSKKITTRITEITNEQMALTDEMANILKRLDELEEDRKKAEAEHPKHGKKAKKKKVEKATEPPILS